MIGPLVPRSAYAEMYADVPASEMFPVEAAAIARAVPARRREFGTVRYCARMALRRLGFPGVPVLPDVDGAPRWPVGAVGSMTHCVGYRAAVVARSDELLAVGIDAEPHAPLPDTVVELVLRNDERPRLQALAKAHPDRHWSRIVFCVKEAIYKAWFPKLGGGWTSRTYRRPCTSTALSGRMCAPTVMDQTSTSGAGWSTADSSSPAPR